MQSGETLGDAIRREAAEETGAVLHELCLFGVYSNFSEAKSDHVVFFCSEDFEWAQTGRWEIENADCFALDGLPSGTSPGTRRGIAEYAGDARAVGALW